MQKQIKEIKSLIIDKSEDELISDIKNAGKHLSKFVEIVESFEKEYNAQKQRRNALDFNDLEEKFVLLLSDEEIKSSIASNYKYIFVDEYQDINSVQELILSKLLENNCMYMVGDVKQSIYGFRNSSPSIFVDKSLAYSTNEDNKDALNTQKQGQLITLNDNFRSNPEILNFVNAIFKKTMSSEFGGVDYQNNGMLNGKTQYKRVDNIPSVKLCICSKESDDSDDSEEKEIYSDVYSVLDDKNAYSKSLSSARRQAMVVAQNILELIGKNLYNAKTYQEEGHKSSENEIKKQSTLVPKKKKKEIKLI
jgi:ATP-dependent helicase/nuclease subunit A